MGCLFLGGMLEGTLGEGDIGKVVRADSYGSDFNSFDYVGKICAFDDTSVRLSPYLGASGLMNDSDAVDLVGKVQVLRKTELGVVLGKANIRIRFWDASTRRFL